MARLSELLLGLAVLALGALIAFQVSGLEAGPTYARVGPKEFPYLVAAGLGLIGAGLLVSALRGGALHRLPEIDVPPLLYAIAGMVAVILTLERGGFPTATALLVAFTARAFGSRRFVIDLGIGLVLGLVCLFVFNVGLGVTLPRGPFEAFF